MIRNTTPLIPSTTPSQSQSRSIPLAQHVFTKETNISVSSSEQLYAIDQNQQLNQYLDTTVLPISAKGLTIVDYQSGKGKLVYQAGKKDDPENSLYLLNLSNRTQVKLNLNPYRPITSYSLNPDENTLAFLSTTNSSNNLAKLYFYNLTTHNVTLEQKNISNISTLSWLNDDSLLMADKKYLTSIYSRQEKAIVIKNLPITKNTITLDTGKKNLFFINSKTNTLSSLNISTQAFTDIIPLKSPALDLIRNQDGQLLLVIKKDDQYLVQSIDPAKKEITKESPLTLEDGEEYIEHFQAGSYVYAKTYNPRSQKTFIRSFSL